METANEHWHPYQADGTPSPYPTNDLTHAHHDLESNKPFNELQAGPSQSSSQLEGSFFWVLSYGGPVLLESCNSHVEGSFSRVSAWHLEEHPKSKPGNENRNRGADRRTSAFIV